MTTTGYGDIATQVSAEKAFHRLQGAVVPYPNVRATRRRDEGGEGVMRARA